MLHQTRSLERRAECDVCVKPRLFRCQRCYSMGTSSARPLQTPVNISAAAFFFFFFALKSDAEGHELKMKRNRSELWHARGELVAQ